ncbi:hypothetical protein LP420_15655 [Massilia sp. B-10]|nr:hypothetical protein LP420_15655 [Massilia sp. B-10]
MAINGKHLDPGFLNPSLPKADLSVTLAARIGADRKVKGSVLIENQGPALHRRQAAAAAAPCAAT